MTHNTTANENAVDHNSAVTWMEKPVALENFAANNTLPGLALIVKGRYRSIGSVSNTGSLAMSTPDNVVKSTNELNGNNIIFIQSIEKACKVLMEAVKPHPGGRHVVTTGRKFSLPLTYQGLFEVLSEDGRPCRLLKSVAELVRVWPRECVVRENVRALVSSPPSSRGASTTRLERSRVIQAGERLILYDQVTVNLEAQSGKVTPSSQSTRQYLRCIDDQKNTVFLNLQQANLNQLPCVPSLNDEHVNVNIQRVRISPVAGPNNISGVHDIMSLLQKFRLPMTVHLVCGFIPPKIDKTFTPVFRLVGLYEDEIAFVLPVRLASASDSLPAVHRDSGSDKVTHRRTEPPLIVGSNIASVIHAAGRMMTISTREPLFVVGARNAADLAKRPDFRALRHRSETMVTGYANSIHVLVPELQPDIESLARSTDELRVSHDDVNEFVPPNTGSSNRKEIEMIFDEIDDIYRYVREGGDPPTRRHGQATSQSVQLPPSNQSWMVRSTIDLTDENDFPANPVYDEDEESTYQRIVDVVAPKIDSRTRKEPTGNEDASETKVQEYWEEPIYADIEQIKERKRMLRRFGHNLGYGDHEEHQPTVESSLQTAGSSSKHNDAGDHQTETMISSSATLVTMPGDEDLISVGNLRQLMKRESSSRSSTNPSPSTPFSSPGQYDEISKINEEHHGLSLSDLSGDHRQWHQALNAVAVGDDSLTVGKTAETNIGSASSKAEFDEGRANLDLEVPLSPSSPTSSRTVLTPTNYFEPSSLPMTQTDHLYTTTSNTLRTVSTPNMTLNMPNVDNRHHQQTDMMERWRYPTDESTSSSTTLNRDTIAPAVKYSQPNLVEKSAALDSPGAGEQHPIYQQPVASSSFSSPWFDPADSAASRPVAIHQGTTAVIVSRSKPSLIHQHHYRAAAGAAEDVVAPVSGLSRVAVVGGAPVSVIHSSSPGLLNARQQAGQFVHRHPIYNDVRAGPPPNSVVAHGVTRISTLTRGLGGSKPNADRVQSSV